MSDTEKSVEAATPPPQTEVLQVDTNLAAKADQGKGEMSVATIARLMGIATATDMQVVEGKIDLLFSKVTAMTVRVEKILSALNQAPTGSDLERIDVQIGSLKAMIRDLVTAATPEAYNNAKKKPTAPAAPIAKGAAIETKDTEGAAEDEEPAQA